MKRCNHCKELLLFSAFSKDRTRADGYERRCKPCDTRRNARWRANNREAFNQKQYRHNRKYPERQRARSLVAYALKKGNLIKESCEVCGETNVHAHHADYSKPLIVKWLCIKHHEQVHH